MRAVEAVGVARRDDVHAALAATLTSRREHRVLFDAAFDAWWRDPGAPGSAGLAQPPGAPGATPIPGRLAQALAASLVPGSGPDAAPRRPDAATAAWSARERLAARDFESMSPAEFEEAVRLVRDLPLPFDPVPSRRRRPSRRGAIDLRGTLRRAARDPSMTSVARRARSERHAPLAILVDVSGSMQRYARVMLLLAHAIAQRRPRVAVFTFGTRLTDVTRALRHRDPDEALAVAARAVSDWDGGTRIGPCIDEFNRLWARRTLAGGGAVLLVTDGLDRADDGSLGRAAERLSRFARPLAWLNPLLRWQGFEARAAGPRALLPHVDRHLPVHSLDSLAALGDALRALSPRRAAYAGRSASPTRAPGPHGPQAARSRRAAGAA